MTVYTEARITDRGFQNSDRKFGQRRQRAIAVKGPRKNEPTDRQNRRTDAQLSTALWLLIFWLSNLRQNAV